MAAGAKWFLRMVRPLLPRSCCCLALTLFLIPRKEANPMTSSLKGASGAAPGWVAHQACFHWPL